MKSYIDGQKLPIVCVDGKIIWKSSEPAFQDIIHEIESAPKPGFFLTNKNGFRDVIVRRHLNRHCILSSDIFYDSKGRLYRDVDARGVGYTVSSKFCSVRLPELDGDMELRGILHGEVAVEDRLNSEEMSELGIRLARHAIHIELFEFVNENGEIVKRSDLGFGNMDLLKPTLAVRAMGTTSRVSDIYREDVVPYAKEIVDDAVELVSTELDSKLNHKDYAVWFIETLGRQLGVLHKNRIWTDAGAQIHRGTHNVTLDCRLTDTARFQTPMSNRREYEKALRDIERNPEMKDLYPDLFQGHSEEEIRVQNAKGEEWDKQAHRDILENFVNGICDVYPLGNLKPVDRFEKAYLDGRGKV